MTTTEQPLPELDRRQVAHDARSILACPGAVSLMVEGEDHAVDEDLGLVDRRGTPTFLCRADSLVARAADAGLGALLTVTSGLGAHDGPERGDTLTIAGRLESTGFERCACCREMCRVVSLQSSFVLLARPVVSGPPGLPDRHLRIPLDDFRSCEHHLNRGHLQRSAEHANDDHQEELRRAVALGTRTRPGDLAGVRIARLSPADVTLQWVDVGGAHQRTLDFPRRARDLAELGELLRRRLHAGIC